MTKMISLDTKITELDLPVRAYNALKNADIHVVKDLIVKTQDELLGMVNFGTKSLNAIKYELDFYGLKLGTVLDGQNNEMNDVIKRVNDNKTEISLLKNKIECHAKNHDHLVRLHNQVARAVVKIEDDIAKMEDNSRIPPTLRDQFAMAALTGLLAGRSIGEGTTLAEKAYDFADDMIAARKEKK